MKVVVLASGSKGNVTYIEDKETKLLIDIGKPCSYIEKELKDIGVNPSDINALLITHTHYDHIDGIRTFYKRYKPNLYVMPKMVSVLSEFLGEFKYTYYEKDTMINHMKIDIVRTSHDAPDSVGFIIDDKLVYITDTGYLNENLFSKLKNKHIYIMESNHDIEMLYNGKYPYYLKRRIASDKGHLSNEDAARCLSYLIGDNTKHVILAHLSQENNTKEKALETFLNTIGSNNNFNIVVATQDERTEVIEI